MTKESVLGVLFFQAENYQKNLENKEMLFLFGNLQEDDMEYIEVKFTKEHFFHLTGVKLSKQSTIHNSFEFYDACINHRLKPSDIYINLDGTTEKKISVLPHLTSIYKNPNKIGLYNYQRQKLKTELLIGDQNYCVGFVQPDKDGCFIPNTLLKENIRKVVYSGSQRIMAVLSKNCKEPYYNELNYINYNKYTAETLPLCDISEKVAKQLVVRCPKNKVKNKNRRKEKERRCLDKQIERADKKKYGSKYKSHSMNKKRMQKNVKDYSY